MSFELTWKKVATRLIGLLSLIGFGETVKKIAPDAKLLHLALAPIAHATSDKMQNAAEEKIESLLEGKPQTPGKRWAVDTKFSDQFRSR